MKVALEMRPCTNKRSGVGTYEYELSKRLQYSSDIELIGDMYNFLNRKDYSYELQGLKFEMENCGWIDYGIYRRIWHIVPISYRMLFKREVDITHFFNFIVPPRIEGKIINTIHDLTYCYYPETMDKRNLKRIQQNIKYSVERSQCIVTVSQNSKKDIMKQFELPDEKVHVIYPGVDIQQFSNTYSNLRMNEVRQKYRLPQDFILYMGTLEPRKNVTSIIEAFYKLKQEGDYKIKEVKLVLAGKKGWLWEEVFKRAQELKLEEEVIFTDYVREEDKASLYRLSQGFIFPSLYEGFGIPVLEAMAASVPVITSDSSSLPEVVGDAALLVGARDIEAMAKGMYEIITNQECRDKLIHKGNERVKKFSWDHSAKKLYELYKSIV